MTAKEDLLRAARQLSASQMSPFTPAELIAEARRQGSKYPDTTLRTMLMSHLRVDEGRVALGQGFRRTGNGLYALADQSDAGPNPAMMRSSGTPVAVDVSISARSSDEWLCERSVQAAVVRWLVSNDWNILRVADTASREHGVDVEAHLGSDRLLVEVKGYPSATYARGELKGVPKKYGAATQARTYFGNALLSGLLMRAEHVRARVALAFPSVATYRDLSARTASPLAAAAIELWLVSQHGDVEQLPTPHA